MNKAQMTLLTVTAVGAGEVPYAVNIAAGEQWQAEKACKALNNFVQKKWTPTREITMLALMDKNEKSELIADLTKALTAAQAKRIMKALELVYINHRVDVECNIFATEALTAI